MLRMRSAIWRSTTKSRLQRVKDRTAAAVPIRHRAALTGVHEMMDRSRPEWLSPRIPRENYVDRAVRDVREAQKQLFLAVVGAEVRARSKGLVLGPEWLKQ